MHKTIRPDHLTALMAADAVHKGSVRTIDMGPGKVGWVESLDPSGANRLYSPCQCDTLKSNRRRITIPHEGFSPTAGPPL